jgi:hypothetical protein
MTQRRETIGNIIVVSLLTLLIWWWAAGETSLTEVIYNQEISLVASKSTSTIVRHKTISVEEVKIRGPRKAVQRMAERFHELSKVTVGSPGVPATNGPHVIDLTTLVTGIVARAQEPVTVVSTKPASAEIEIILRSQRDANIQPTLPEGVRTTGAITVDPPTGTLVLPDTLVKKGETFTLAAIVTPEMLENLEPGRRHVVKAEVSLPAELLSKSDRIEFDPREVEVSVALLSAEVEHTIPSVPVQVAAPPADLARYSVTIAQGVGFLRDVTLRGPPDAITRIEKGETSVVAFVHLTSDDLVQHVTERPVAMWSLPPGVTVVRVGTGNTTTPQVELEIVDRTAP